MIRLLYWLFEKQFLKIYFSRQPKKGFSDMAVKFVDSNGMKYYCADDDFKTPHLRTKEIQYNVMLLNAGLSQAELDLIWEAMEKALNSGKKSQLAFIGHLVIEGKKRKEMVLHPDIMMEIVALKFIREDEDPTVIDKAIHDEKIKQFWKDSKDGLHDFFYGAGLSQYMPYLTKSESDWKEFYLESKVKIRSMKQHLTEYLLGEELLSK